MKPDPDNAGGGNGWVSPLKDFSILVPIAGTEELK